jgi:hypothetical protein
MSKRPAALGPWRQNTGPAILQRAASRSGMINQRRSTYPDREPVQTSEATSPCPDTTLICKNHRPIIDRLIDLACYGA